MNTSGQPEVHPKAEVRSKHMRAAVGSAILLAFLSLFLGVILTPDSANALVEQRRAGAPLLQDDETPTATPSATPTATTTPTATPVPSLDVESAQPLACGGVYAGNTETGQNNVTTYSCWSWWDESGKEKVYWLELTAQQAVTITLLQGSTDLDLFLLRSGLSNSCVAGGDNYLTHTADAGPYFVSVDGYRGASGSYLFRVDCPAEVQATATPTLTPSSTPTNTPTRTPGPTPTVTPSLIGARSYMPILVLPYTGPTPLPITFVLQDGLNGYTGATDTTLDSRAPTASFGADKVLRIAYASASEIISPVEALLGFELDLLPQRTSVSRAVLRLYVEATPLQDIRAQVAGLLHTWDEQTATWELAAEGQPWTLPGARSLGYDRTTWMSAPQRIVGGAAWYEFDVTALVRQWLYVPSFNRGMIVSALAGDSNASVEVQFVSREGSASKRPQLVISYFLPEDTGE